MITFGEKIHLSGFKEVVDGASMIVLKKIIGHYFSKIETFTQLNELSLNLKPIHHTTANDGDKPKKFELKVKIVTDKNAIFNAEGVSMNLYELIDDVLRKIIYQLESN
jgi:ribosome-associated translation inhibitor RaiA